MRPILWVGTVVLFALCFWIPEPGNIWQFFWQLAFYKISFLIYLGLYILLATGIYFQMQRINRRLVPLEPEDENQEYAPVRTGIYLMLILCIGFLMRTVIAPSITGHPYDIKVFSYWSSFGAGNLPHIFVNPLLPANYKVDYPPLYLYILALLGKISGFFHISGGGAYYLILKLPAILADVATAWLLYWFSKKNRISDSMSLFLAGLYIFNPVTIFDTAVWGQVDSFFTLFILAGLLLVQYDRIPWAAAVFTAAILFKPQGLIVLPVLFWELAKRKSFKLFLWTALSALLTFIIVILPFSFCQEPLWIVKLFIKITTRFPYASMNAFNFFALLGANFKDGAAPLFIFNYHTWGLIFEAGLVVFVSILYLRTFKGRETDSNRLLYITPLILYAGVFVLASRMHERYLFQTLAISLLAYIHFRDRRILVLFAGLTVTNYLNIAKIFFDEYNHFYGTDWLIPVVSLANVLLFIYLMVVMLNLAAERRVLDEARMPIDPLPFKGNHHPLVSKTTKK